MFSVALTMSLVFAAAEQDDAPKILAKAAYKLGQTSKVVRSAEELGKLANSDADKATAQLVKALKVESIDWEKQMLIVISGGSRPTGGYSVTAQKLEVKDGKLMVHWKLKSPPKGAFVTQAITHPMQVILADRFAGDVAFDPATPPGKKRD